MGCKTKINRDLISKMCEHIEDGDTKTRACIVCGISQDTLYSWLKKADKEKGLFKELKEGIAKAEASFIQKHIKIVSDAGKSDWKASAWLLERKVKDEFGKALDITSKGESITGFNVSVKEDAN